MTHKVRLQTKNILLQLDISLILTKTKIIIKLEFKNNSISILCFSFKEGYTLLGGEKEYFNLPNKIINTPSFSLISSFSSLADSKSSLEVKSNKNKKGEKQ